MIAFDHVTKHAIEHGSKRCILKNASFTIQKGARLAFLSDHPNDGVTFLNMLTRVQPIDRGKISTDSTISWILGKPFGISESLTARKNIRIICGIYGMSRQKSDQVAEMVATFTGLGIHIDDPIATYRTEMKRRLEFALFLSIHFDFYLIKGNVSVGNGEFKKKSKEALINVASQSGIVLASSNLQIVRSICTSCLVVKSGIAIFHDDIKEGIAAHLSGKDTGKSSKKIAKNAILARKWARKRARKSIVE